jgi:putative GTP pyrophosphokinase
MSNEATRDRYIQAAVKKFEDQRFEFELFSTGIADFFRKHPRLSGSNTPVIHSVKMRLKDPDHLREKLMRKWTKGDLSEEHSIFSVITDLSGVRVLHLYQQQFQDIHDAILEKVEKKKDWTLHEPPKAYTWDPESALFFKQLNLAVESKESFYTSIHYVVRPRSDSDICCEIQVRTLFEEIWGEVDHTLNYPNPTTNLSCKEQIRVLAKLVGAGSRLVDSVFKTSGTQNPPPFSKLDNET